MRLFIRTVYATGLRDKVINPGEALAFRVRACFNGADEQKCSPFSETTSVTALKTPGQRRRVGRRRAMSHRCR